MKRLLVLLFFASTLFAQSGYIPVISSIPLSAWQLGAGSTTPTLSDGTQVLEIGYGSNASVDLGVTPAQLQEYKPGYTREGAYRLTFSVENLLGNYPGYYSLEVDFGTQELCSVDGWGTASVFTNVTVICPGPGYIVIDQALPGAGPAQGTNNFVIHATSPGWPVHLRNFSLTFTPVP